jgi:hypothetical protein
MKKLFAGLVAAAVLGLGITQASAHGHRDRHHHDRHGGWSFGITIGDPYWDPYPVRPIARGCTVERASMKARHMGIRNQRITRNDWSIKVRGTRHGYPARVVFAREPGCPVIR